MQTSIIFNGSVGSRVVRVTPNHIIYSEHGVLMCEADGSRVRLKDLVANTPFEIAGSQLILNTEGQSPVFYNLDSKGGLFRPNKFSGATGVPPVGSAIWSGSVVHDGMVYGGNYPDSDVTFLYHSIRGLISCGKIGDFTPDVIQDVFTIGPRVLIFATGEGPGGADQMAFLEVEAGDKVSLVGAPFDGGPVCDPHGLILPTGDTLIVGESSADKPAAVLIRNGKVITLKKGGAASYTCNKAYLLPNGTVFVPSCGLDNPPGSACLARPGSDELVAVNKLWNAAALSGLARPNEEHCDTACLTESGTIRIGINNLVVELPW